MTTRVWIILGCYSVLIALLLAAYVGSSYMGMTAQMEAQGLFGQLLETSITAFIGAMTALLGTARAPDK